MSKYICLRGGFMTYLNKKELLYNLTQSPAVQNISTTYTEITGSKGEFTPLSSNSKIVYKFMFNIQLDYTTSSKWFLHVKLQESNDNFTSNITDVSGANYNISSDDVNTIDHLYKVTAPMFVIDSFSGTKQLRLVCRSYSTSLKPQLHRCDYFDGAALSFSTDTTLLIFEV